MSVKEAFRFIEHIRTDTKMSDDLDRVSGLEDLAALAARNGFRFTIAEIQQAYATDAAMRRWHYISKRKG